MPLRLTENQYRRLVSGEAVELPNKYRSQVAFVGGERFQSKHEARFYQELLLRAKAGEIRNLLRQVVFDLAVNGVVICRYLADFVAEERVRLPSPLPGLDPVVWERRIWDTKSDVTRRNQTYRIKFKLMAAMGNHITEVLSQPRRRRRSKWRRR